MDICHLPCMHSYLCFLILFPPFFIYPVGMENICTGHIFPFICFYYYLFTFLFVQIFLLDLFRVLIM